MVAPPALKQYLDPAMLRRLGRLEIAARMVKEGFVTGRHRSPHHGTSVEFAEHRQYVPGDEIRSIDWKVFARMDRFYIKKYEEETNLRCYLLLDASGSMGYGPGGRNKLEYGKRLCAVLAYLLLKQRDSVGLVTFGEAVKRYIPPRTTPTHLPAIVEELAATEPAGPTGLTNVLHDVAERIRRRGLIILLSDLFEEPTDIMRGLSHFRFKKHEVIVFHLLDPDELNFPFNRWTLFRGLEGVDPDVLTEPQRIRRSYLEAVSGFRQALQRGCRERQVDYHLMDTGVSGERALADYLGSRAQLR